MKNVILVCSLLICSLVAANPVDTGHARASLITNIENSTQESFYVGVRLKMQDGWHTYWENPGDSGSPFEANWKVSVGTVVENVQWPTPVTIPYPPLMTFGYEGDVVFPFKVFRSLDSPLEKISLEFDFLICADICIPESASLTLDLSSATPSLLLNEAVTNLPTNFIQTNSSNDQESLKVTFQSSEEIKSAYLFPKQDNLFVYTPSQKLVKLHDDTYEISVPLLSSDINFFSGILSLNGEGFQIEENLQSVSSMSLWQAILFALIGGLILNLMPCVFPVISLKVLSFVSMGGDDHAKIRTHALSFAGGVMSTFISIATALLIIRSSGSMIGWGYQLQSPIVVGILTLIMLGIGLVLLTNINFAAGLTTLGSSVQSRNDYSGSFFTGVLAVVVASPCTAPFMGAAIGYALLQPSFATLPIFIALGLGFAGPYLILALKPQWISALPKPGAWMETLKQFFAFPMIATALWLMWVFMVQTSGDALILLLILSLILGVAVWMIATFKGRWKWIGMIMTLITAFQIFNKLPASSNEMKVDASAEKWSLEIESEMQSQNQAYLINFTAAWCITCQTNEKTALAREKVKEYLAEENITYVKADWTNRNEDIAIGLAKYKRTGIPLYIFWKPGMRGSKILPAVLTEDSLIKSMQ
ncbi:protein-disulfide reductase DsbD family protein [Gammaproteobacteria bacterium]|nr:protein-disulfide reductase DsbD family protein [Gammaproteobacteria bacterium]MDB9947435.1 protein-disulfide reductase DsbD family protein [Gammaproteobacteria bacterium]